MSTDKSTEEKSQETSDLTPFYLAEMLRKPLASPEELLAAAKEHAAMLSGPGAALPPPQDPKLDGKRQRRPS